MSLREVNFECPLAFVGCIKTSAAMFSRCLNSLVVTNLRGRSVGGVVLDSRYGLAAGYVNVRHTTLVLHGFGDFCRQGVFPTSLGPLLACFPWFCWLWCFAHHRLLSLQCRSFFFYLFYVWYVIKATMAASLSFGCWCMFGFVL